MPSARRWPVSVPAHRTAPAPTTFGVMWPKPGWRWTGERRARCAAQCGGGALSNGAGWRTSVQPRHLRQPPQTSVPSPRRRRVPPPPKRRRPVRRAPSACPRRLASWRRRVGPRLGKRAWRTRWERACAGMVRRCGVCFTTARVVRFTRPVDGCVRPSRPYATRWSATCTPQKGACSVVVATPGRLHGPRTRGLTGGRGARWSLRPRPASSGGDPGAERHGHEGRACGAVHRAAAGVGGQRGSR